MTPCEGVATALGKVHRLPPLWVAQPSPASQLKGELWSKKSCGKPGLGSHEISRKCKKQRLLLEKSRSCSGRVCNHSELSSLGNRQERSVANWPHCSVCLVAKRAVERLLWGQVWEVMRFLRVEKGRLLLEKSCSCSRRVCNHSLGSQRERSEAKRPHCSLFVCVSATEKA